MSKVKCMDCGTKEKSWEDAERVSWQKCGKKYLCGRCVFLRRDKARRSGKTNYVPSGSAMEYSYGPDSQYDYKYNRKPGNRRKRW